MAPAESRLMKMYWPRLRLTTDWLTHCVARHPRPTLCMYLHLSTTSAQLLTTPPYRARHVLPTHWYSATGLRHIWIRSRNLIGQGNVGNCTSLGGKCANNNNNNFTCFLLRHAVCVDYLYLYTVSQETRHLTLAHNFTKHLPIFKILSLLDSVGNL